MRNTGTTLHDLPRARLEEVALRAAIEVKRLRAEANPNAYFIAALGGLLGGAALATLAFLIGAAVR